MYLRVECFFMRRLYHTFFSKYSYFGSLNGHCTQYHFCATVKIMEERFTTSQVAILLEMSLEEFKVFRHGLKIKGIRWKCKNKSVAWLFSKEQVETLLYEQLNKDKRRTAKEESRKLLSKRFKNREIDRRNSLLKVLPIWI